MIPTPRPLRAPSLVMLLLLYVIVGALTVPFANTAGNGSFALSAYISVLWSLPTLFSVLVLVGVVKSRRRIAAAKAAEDPAPVKDLVIVQLPTVGRDDVLPSLCRVVQSLEANMPRYFRNWRVDIVSEEDAPAVDQLKALRSKNIRVLFVPRDYRTENGTQNKARANCWVSELRIAEGESRDNCWVLHLDDDSGVGVDTVREVARVIRQNPMASDAKHLAQGVVTFRRDFSASRLTWLADAMRPTADVSLFNLTTGGGMPVAGLHGELLLVRASIEDSLGWDGGRWLSVTEDAHFGLRFAAEYPGRSTWFPGRSYGASPATVGDLITQRRRWSRGLFHIIADRSVALRYRALLGYTTALWALGPLSHILLVMGVAMVLSGGQTVPVATGLVVAWAINFATTIWSYIEGLRLNLNASGRRLQPHLVVAVVVMTLPFTLIEGYAGLRGFLAFVRDRATKRETELFEVIPKPYLQAAA